MYKHAHAWASTPTEEEQTIRCGLCVCVLKDYKGFWLKRRRHDHPPFVSSSTPSTQTLQLIIDELMLVFTYPGSPGALPQCDHIVMGQNQKWRWGWVWVNKHTHMLIMHTHTSSLRSAGATAWSGYSVHTQLHWYIRPVTKTVLLTLSVICISLCGSLFRLE